jgi:hypothetical protein
MKAVLLAFVSFLVPATPSSIVEDALPAGALARNITVIYKSYDELAVSTDEEYCDIYLADIEGYENESLLDHTMLRND